MKKFKQLLCLALALTISASLLAACGQKDNGGSKDSDEKVLTYAVEGGSAGEEIALEKGWKVTTLDGQWIGFDADLAKLVAERLGVEIQFVVIDWGQKINELDSKAIDVVWNGMTLTDGVMSAMACTNAYCKNAQVVVVRGQ